MRKLKTIEMHRLSVEEFKEARKLPLIVVLDNVRSLYNVGSVFRSADAFRVAAIYLCGITACPPNAEIHKTALGGEDSVAWRYFSDTLEAVANNAPMPPTINTSATPSTHSNVATALPTPVRPSSSAMR